MRAYVVENFGDLDVIQLQEVKEPKPKKHECKIKVKATSVNPVEWKLAKGVLKDILPHKFPFILGWDVAGVVTEVGENVSNLNIGDDVFGYCRGEVVQNGTFADYTCFDAAQLCLKPQNLSFEEAATIPLVGLTALQALVDVAHLKKGQTCLIHAGAGGVGSLAIPLAKKMGATVLTTASSRNTEYVKKLGADLVFDYTKGDVTAQIKQHFPDGADFVFDCVGGETNKESYHYVKKGGILVSIVVHADKELASSLGIRSTNVFVRPSGEQMQQLKELFEHGFPLPEIEVMPFSKVHEALEKIKTGHTRGKIAISLA